MKSIAACELKSGKTKSCGCYDAERKRTETVKHGFNRTPTYVCWSNMLARCTNPKRRDFKNYGGRGISVCERWRSFENFLADMGEKPPKLSLDRVDNDENYGPDNCRWATQKQQVLNRRNTINPNNEPMTLLQIRMSPQEKAMALELAAHYGVTLSGFVRLAVAYAKENKPAIGIPSKRTT